MNLDMYWRNEYLINQTPSLAQYIIMVSDPQALCVYFSFENLLGSISFEQGIYIRKTIWQGNLKIVVAEE